MRRSFFAGDWMSFVDYLFTNKRPECDDQKPHPASTFSQKTLQKRASTTTKKKYLRLTYRSRLTPLQQGCSRQHPPNRVAPEQHLKRRDEQSMKE
jgi:hypothetical protein